MTIDEWQLCLDRREIKTSAGVPTGKEKLLLRGWNGTLPQDKKYALAAMREKDHQISGLPVLYVHLKAVYNTVVKTSSFSEYIVPYILAVLAALEFFGMGIIGRILSFFTTNSF